MTRPARRQCIAPFCDRPSRKNSQFCGRCWGYVPAPYKLAIEEHYSAYHNAAFGDPYFVTGAAEWSRSLGRRFLVWSWEQTMVAAAEEATRQRFGWEHPELFA